MIEPTMVENSWKITFYPKDEKKPEDKEATAVQGDTGGGATVEVDEEEEKKGQEEDGGEAVDFTESVKVQV